MTEGANGDHMLGACFHSFLDSERSIPLTPVVIAGQDAASAAAAIGIGLDPPHLPQIDSGDRFQKFPGFIIEAVFIVQTDISTCPELGSIFIDDKLRALSSCMAGVMVRHFPVHRFGEL